MMKVQDFSAIYLMLSLLVFMGSACQNESYDLVIRNALIYDGSGDPPFTGEIAIKADTIAAIADHIPEQGTKELDAQGMAVSPGFINMLSWATESLLVDGRGMSDLKQGVTLEVMGEGWSMGPLNESMRKELTENQGDVSFEVQWTTLGEYLQHLEDKGVAMNVASFVGATSVRIYVLGYEDRAPTREEMEEMKQLVEEAMREGALGVGSSLIYAPAWYANTQELIELCNVASRFDGMYITHMRSEGNKLLEAVEEVLQIARISGVRAEIYHLIPVIILNFGEKKIKKLFRLKLTASHF